MAAGRMGRKENTVASSNKIWMRMTVVENARISYPKIFRRPQNIFQSMHIVTSPHPIIA
jgi:hypothetical protein